MPIRLLRFKTHGRHFEISLIVKGDIFAHIYTKIQAEFTSRVLPFTGTGLAEHASYVISSYTWLYDAPGEVIYENWHKEDLRNQDFKNC